MLEQVRSPGEALGAVIALVLARPVAVGLDHVVVEDVLVLEDLVALETFDPLLVVVVIGAVLALVVTGMVLAASGAGGTAASTSTSTAATDIGLGLVGVGVGAAVVAVWGRAKDDGLLGTQNELLSGKNVSDGLVVNLVHHKNDAVLPFSNIPKFLSYLWITVSQDFLAREQEVFDVCHLSLGVGALAAKVL